LRYARTLSVTAALTRPIALHYKVNRLKGEQSEESLEEALVNSLSIETGIKDISNTLAGRAD